MTDWKNRIVSHGEKPASEFLANPHNPRKHPQNQRDAVRGSLDTLGWIAPVIELSNGYLLDGHERIYQALDMGDDTPVPYIVVDLTEAEAKLALASFDFLTTMATYDRDALDTLLKEVQTDDTRLQAMLSEMAAANDLYFGDEPTTADDPGAQVDRAGELQAIWQVQRGQVWRIGRHKLMCGDSTSAEDVARLMDGAKMQGAFTSPPYAEQRKEQYGGIPADEYVAWWDAIQANVRTHLKDDGSFFVNIKPHCEDGERSLYVMDLVLAMRRQWGWRYVDELCWKRAGYPGGFDDRFRNDFEPVHHFSSGKKLKLIFENVLQPSKYKRDSTTGSVNTHSGLTKMNFTDDVARPSNVLDIPGASHDADKSVAHPAKFPVALPDFFIRAFSDNGDTWYDPFMGSGTVIVAAEQNNRAAFGMELKPEYCAVILQRLKDMGLSPELDT